MTDVIEKKETPAVETPPATTVAPTAETTTVPSQNKKEPKSRLEKLRHTRASIDRQIAEEETASGTIIIDEDDDDKPLTKGDLKRIERDRAKKTALQLANDLEDEDERSRVTELLETRIVPSGNPQKDLELALAAVRSEKNADLARIAARNGTKKPVTRSSGSGAPANEEAEFVPTDDELRAAKTVGKKTAADIKAFILKARAKEQK